MFLNYSDINRSYLLREELRRNPSENVDEINCKVESGQYDSEKTRLEMRPCTRDFDFPSYVSNVFNNFYCENLFIRLAPICVSFCSLVSEKSSKETWDFHCWKIISAKTKANTTSMKMKNREVNVEETTLRIFDINNLYFTSS